MANALNEQLTGKQRIAAALTGKPFDRIPVNLLISDHAAQFANVSVTEYETSAELLVKGQVEAYRYYGHDFINVGPGLTGIAEAFGARVIIPAASTPYVAGPAIEQLTDVGSLKLPEPESSARLPIFLDAAELALRQIGDEVLVTMTLGGPFTTACNIFGTERLLRELRRNGPLVHQLLRVATDAVIRFAKAAIARGARIGLADPTASGSVIGLKVFESFALPYLAEVVRAITKATGGIAPSLHVCGRTQAIWRHLADTGASGLSNPLQVELLWPSERGRDPTVELPIAKSRGRATNRRVKDNGRVANGSDSHGQVEVQHAPGGLLKFSFAVDEGAIARLGN